MQINEKIKELDNKLPRGSRKKIKDITGLDIRTVIKFFQLKPVKLENVHKIISASNEILQDINKRF
jgi:hypothetical protein